MKILIVFFLFLNFSCSTTSDPLHAAFKAYRPDYKDKIKTVYKRFKGLDEIVFAQEKQGMEVTCANQIMNETKWLLYSTADFDLIEDRITDLENEIQVPNASRFPDFQSTTDGSWGRCYTQWFFKAMASYDWINELSKEGKIPKIKTTFLDKINSPEKLLAYLNSVLVSDIVHLGRNNSRELNESISVLIRQILKNYPTNYQYHPKLKETLLNFITEVWQNKETGYWGAWYKKSNGEIVKTDNLSITFHIVSYLKGEVSLLDKIMETTLAIKNLSYPLGWLTDGTSYEDHHNYDVVRLLRYGWAHATEDQKKRARIEIQKMVDWSFHESLQKDGSFKPSSSNDSLEDSYYFGVSFLTEIGYFDVQKLFWSDQNFSDVEITRNLIKDSICEKMKKGPTGSILKNALEKLDFKQCH